MDLQVLRQVSLFRNLDPVQLSHLTSIMQERQLPKDTVLFREGDKPEHFFIIAKGRVRISKMVPGMGEEALAVLDTHGYFGEMELIDESDSRAAQALAHEDCTLYVFGYSDFHALLQADNELALALLWSIVRTLSARLRATNEKMAGMFAMAQFR